MRRIVAALVMALALCGAASAACTTSAGGMCKTCDVPSGSSTQFFLAPTDAPNTTWSLITVQNVSAEGGPDCCWGLGTTNAVTCTSGSGYLGTKLKAVTGSDRELNMPLLDIAGSCDSSTGRMTICAFQ